jgi:hypothetical protein
MFLDAGTESIDTLFDPDQRGEVNLVSLSTKDHRPKRISDETDVSHEGMGEKRISFMDHSPAFQ